MTYHVQRKLRKIIGLASDRVPCKNRLDSVKTAAQATAQRLKLDFEMVKLDKTESPIYVYYEEKADEEPIPLYCDEGKKSNLEEIGSALRNMMFVLSFHPNHSALRQIRGELLKVS